MAKCHLSSFLCACSVDGLLNIFQSGLEVSRFFRLVEKNVAGRSTGCFCSIKHRFAEQFDPDVFHCLSTFHFSHPLMILFCIHLKTV